MTIYNSIFNKIVTIFSIIFLLGCAAKNVNDLKKSKNVHYVYYYDGNLDSIYNRTISKYNECGIPVSNTFIDYKLGVAGASYTAPGHGWYAHTDFKVEDKEKIRVDVYSIIDKGIPGNFIKITKYAVESKIGCPDNLF